MHRPDHQPFDTRAAALLTTAHFATDFCQGALPALLPQFVRQFGLSYAAAGSIILAANLSSSVLQPLFGIMADKRANAWIIPLGTALCAVGLAGVALAPTYAVLLAAVGVLGLGVAAFHPDAVRYAGLVAGSRRTTGMSVFSVGGNAGFAAGPLVVVPLLAAFGGRGVAIAAAVIFAFTLYVYAARDTYAHHVRPASARHGNAPALHDDWPAFARLAGAITLRSITFVGLTTFLPLYWVQSFGRSQTEGASALSALLVAGTVGTLVGGALADRYGRRRVVRTAFLVLVPMLAAFAAVQSPSLGFWLVVPIGFVLFLPFSALVVMGQELLPNRPGTASGVTVGLAVTVGGVAAPLLGLLADRIGLHATLWAVVGLPLGSALLVHALPDRMPVRQSMPTNPAPSAG
ncbi:MAG: MFS transporter [Gemmatimonadaceae bacterium]|nr:MFS transporter [Gemmatimonadaceae bacterium]